MRLHRGVHAELEGEADRILHSHLSKIASPSEKADILTPWKEQDRRRREVYVSEGTPDSANRTGMFHRALNSKHSHLNSATEASLAQQRGRMKGGSG